MVGGAWSHRFVICADTADRELTFLMYGSRFAQLLESPAEPVTSRPIAGKSPGDISCCSPRVVMTPSLGRLRSGPAVQLLIMAK